MFFTALIARNGNLNLSEIVRDVETWKNKPVEMNLKLKKVDYLFEKIVFYDIDNINIEFSISDKKKKIQA